MPRRSVLAPAERASLLAMPVTEDALLRYYTFSEPDLALIRHHRGDLGVVGGGVSGHRG